VGGLRESVNDRQDDLSAVDLGQAFDEVDPDVRAHRQRLEQADRLQLSDLVALTGCAHVHQARGSRRAAGATSCRYLHGRTRACVPGGWAALGTTLAQTPCHAP
jgi:hypothetical protein